MICRLAVVPRVSLRYSILRRADTLGLLTLP
jgi:hypothetical protein